jgi:LuxR family maltose regulon positive regulatory protein
VLDDYHAIEASAIHEAVVFLQEHLPPRVHLVIAGRVDPRLPRARVRARGQLAEIRAAELRVTPNEAVALFREVMGLALTAVAVARALTLL